MLFAFRIPLDCLKCDFDINLISNRLFYLLFFFLRSYCWHLWVMINLFVSIRSKFNQSDFPQLHSQEWIAEKIMKLMILQRNFVSNFPSFVNVHKLPIIKSSLMTVIDSVLNISGCASTFNENKLKDIIRNLLFSENWNRVKLVKLIFRSTFLRWDPVVPLTFGFNLLTYRLILIPCFIFKLT